MDLSIGSSVRVVVAGAPRPRQRYGVKPDGTRGPIGVDTDSAGLPLAQFAATLVGGPVGWVEGATVVAPEPILAGFPPAGTLVELTGALALRISGGDFGSTRTAVLGVVGVRPLGSAVDPLNSVGNTPVSRDRAAS